MQPWLYALMFIALLLAIGWVVDRRTSRVRRGLDRPAAARGGAGLAALGQAEGRVERTAPGTTTQPGWHHGDWQPGP